jgi:hypothetical protein
MLPGLKRNSTIEKQRRQQGHSSGKNVGSGMVFPIYSQPLKGRVRKQRWTQMIALKVKFGRLMVPVINLAVHCEKRI